MNKKSFIVSLLAVISLSACRHIRGSGNIITQSREVANFTALSIKGIVPVEVKNGPDWAVEVEADDNVLPYIKTDVEGNTLVIDMRRMRSFTNVHMKVFVTAPSLTKISCSGVASVTGNGVLKSTDKIELRTSGVGSITAEVDAPEIRAATSGVGGITLLGRCRGLDLNVSGVGSIKAYDLLAEDADANVSGVGSIKVYASVKLKANVSGAGSIRYRGAATATSSVSGVGSVRKDEN